MSKHAEERQIPLILIAVGVALYVVSAFTRTGSAGVGPTLMMVLIGGAIQTVLLIIAAFIVAGVLSVSFGAVGPAALKFAGASLISGGLASMFPYGGLVALLVFLGVIVWLFDLEMTYAIVLVVAYGLVSWGVAIALRNMA